MTNIGGRTLQCRLLLAVAALSLGNIAHRTFFRSSDDSQKIRGWLAVKPLTDEYEGISTSTLCKWTVVAGDSNMRGVFSDWVTEEKKQGNRQVLEDHRIGTMTPRAKIIHDDVEVMNNHNKCTKRQAYTDKEILSRYSDHEMVVLTNSSHHGDDNNAPSTQSCHIITLKLMAHQSEVNRLVSNMTDTSFCGTSLSNSLPTGYRRPVEPDTIWFSHGLWDLPNGGHNADNLNCSTRFEPVVKAMKEWNISSSRAVWQTIFPINKRPLITNQYLEWDVNCQRETAHKHNISIFDLYRHVQPRMPNAVYEGDYHLSEETRKFLFSNILETCCGGKEAYFSATN
jgi:hypothetical protein